MAGREGRGGEAKFHRRCRTKTLSPRRRRVLPMHTGGHIPPALGTCIQCYVSIYISQPASVCVCTCRHVHAPIRMSPVYLASHRCIHGVRLRNERTERNQPDEYSKNRTRRPDIFAIAGRSGNSGSNPKRAEVSIIPTDSSLAAFN